MSSKISPIRLIVLTFLGLLGCVLALTAPASAIPDAYWEQIAAPRPTPMARSHTSAAYDPQRNEVVVFGGFNGARLNDTWIWNGSAWTDVSPPPELSPPARFRHSMTFDSLRNVVVLFGGSGNTGRLNDTWEWDGRAWTNRTPESGANPPIRDSTALAFDSVRNLTVLFGGFKGGTPANLQDTWEWDGEVWTEIVPPESPSARNSMGMTFQESEQRVVLFGGFDTERRNDTWTYDGNNWAPLDQSMNIPPVRNYHTVVFEKSDQQTPSRVLLFGGLNSGSIYLNDTWQLIADEWSRLSTANAPLPRCCFGLVFNSLQKQMILFGGAGGAGKLAALGDLHTFIDPPPLPSPTLSYSDVDRVGNEIALD